MYCRKCKTLISENEKYCPVCGAPVATRAEKPHSKKKSSFTYFSIYTLFYLPLVLVLAALVSLVIEVTPWITLIVTVAASIIAQNYTSKLLNGITQRKIRKLQSELKLLRAQSLAEARARSLPENIDAMSGTDFEFYCIDLLDKNGFSCIQHVGGADDKGVDITAVKDGVSYAIQCKRYSSLLDNTPIQEVFAGKQFYNCHVGVVMTNSNFTDAAAEYAKATGVLLWGRGWLQTHSPDYTDALCSVLEYGEK